MYKKKIPLDMDCGVAIAMEVMGGKWKSCILYELEKGCKRPSELHRHFEEVSPRVINQQLKELEMHGMIEKTIYPELPPHVEYSLTEDGQSLIPIIRMLEQWGNNFRPKMARYWKKSTDSQPGIMLAKWREIKRMAWDLFECNGINIKYALL